MHILVYSQERSKPTRDALITLAPHTLCMLLYSLVSLYVSMRERGTLSPSSGREGLQPQILTRKRGARTNDLQTIQGITYIHVDR